MNFFSHLESEILICIYSIFSGALLCLLYVWHNNFTNYTRSFIFTIFIVVVLMTAILNSVGTNIAASISLFGALSLLRFRSAVKSPDDMGFLLTAVTFGLIIGTHSYYLLVPILIILFCLVFVFKFLCVKKYSQTQTFVISYKGEKVRDSILNLLNSNGIRNINIESKYIKVTDQQREITICCSGAPIDSLRIMEELTSINGILKVKSIANEEI